MSEKNDKPEMSGKKARRPAAKPKPVAKKEPVVKKEPVAKPKSAGEATKAATGNAPSKSMIASNSDESGISRSLFGVLLVAIVVGGGFATQPLWMPYIVDYLPGLKKSAQLEAPEDTLVDRLGEIKKEVTRIRQGDEPIADLEHQRNQMNQSFEGVMARIIELEKQIDYVRGMLQATSPPLDAVQTNESLQRLSSRMNKLEKSDETVNTVMERLAMLEQAMSDSGSNANSSAEQLAQTMIAISERLGRLENGVAKFSAGEAVASAQAQQQVQAQTLVLAVGHLRETLRSSSSFVPALGALKALGHGDPDIMRGVNEMAPYAQTGVATLDILRRDFSATAEAIYAAAPQAPSEDTLDDVLSTIKSLVSFRKAGTLKLSGDSDAPAAKAMARLDEGDLDGAIAALSGLSGAQMNAAAPWLARARVRLMVETTLSRLHVFVVSLLAPTSN